MPTTGHSAERSGIWLNPPQPILYPVDALPLARHAVLVAEAELLRGVREVGGANRGPDVEAYQVGLYGDGRGYLEGAKWCARFVRYCYERAARELGEPRPFIGWRVPGKDKDSDLASAVKWEKAARARGSLVVRTNVRFGDVGLFITPAEVDPSQPGHVVLVVGRRGDQVVTIEGNFRDRVAMVVRDPQEFAAIARVV